MKAAATHERAGASPPAPAPDAEAPPASCSHVVEYLKIGDFAELAGTNLRTLRYYEEIGLMRPAMRSNGGFRYYRRTDVNRLNMIRTLQELGLQLEQIKDLLGTRAAPVERRQFLDGVRRALDAQERLLDARMAKLRRQRERIDVARAKLAECEGCALQPCPENNFCEPCATTGRSLPEDLSALF